MSEHEEQAAVVRWCELHGVPVFAIPNAAQRSHRTASYMIAEGLRKGVPDLMVPVARGGYHGLFVEMKDKGGRPPRESQLKWLEELNAQGYAAYWARGADKAIALIEAYMRG